jgi:quercetin dioxygenase-like cupin family protein
MPAPDPVTLRKFEILPGYQRSTARAWHLPGSQIVALVTGQQTQGNLAIFEQTMEPGGAVPLHINHREDESFYLLDGRYLFEVSGSLNQLGPGSHIFVPRGTPHRFRYVSETPGKMLIVCQPAGIESAFDELERLPQPVKSEDFASVCQKFRIEVLGPPLAER